MRELRSAKELRGSNLRGELANPGRQGPNQGRLYHLECCERRWGEGIARQESVRISGCLVKRGADDGNRTRVFSLGSYFRHRTCVRTPAGQANSVNPRNQPYQGFPGSRGSGATLPA